MPLLRLALVTTAVLLNADIVTAAEAPVAKVGAAAAAAPVPERCLLGLKRKQISEVSSAVLSPAETVVLIDQPKKDSVLGICGAEGPLRGTVTLPRVEPYGDACKILGKECDGPGDLDGKLAPGQSVLKGRFFEVVAGDWALAVERSAAVETGSEESGPGEELSLTTLYVFRATGGKLARILMMPLRASRTDAELNDNFETTVGPESVGVLQFERTIKNGVYPDSVKERTRRGHLRWNGKRLVLGS